jgi:hypothetical protein
MLDRPPERTLRIMEFADHLETVDPADFNMLNWRQCIAGHCKKYFQLAGEPAMATMKFLGIDDTNTGLFVARILTPKQAAKEIRGLVQ